MILYNDIESIFGGKMYRVSVKYKYILNGHNWILTSSSYRVEGRSESSIINCIKRQHGAIDVILLSYEWLE
jgi:hypothetical protein